MDTLTGILGVLGFALSVGILLYEIRRRHYRLQMYVGGVDIMPQKDKSAIVIIHFCFLNPSSEYKVISHISKHMPVGLTVFDFEKRRSDDPEESICVLPNDKSVYCHIVTDESLQTPLDIPPLQSQRKKCPFFIQWDDAVEQLYQRIPIAIGFSSLTRKPYKTLCSCNVQLPLDWLKNGGLYYLP
jgi:hypothetical protein